jgi:hypothetical protein
MIPASVALFQKYFRSQIDWWLIGLLFCISFIFFGVSRFLNKRIGNRSVPPMKPRLAVEGTATETPPRPVDLRGEILELYFHEQNSILGVSECVTVIMRMRIVNHGPTEATITHCDLQVCLGQERLSGSLLNRRPDSWAIRRRDDKILSVAYVETAIAPLLGADDIYPKGIPRSGFMLFEVYSLQNIEFPNAHFVLSLKDSLGGVHCIERKPMFYRKTGELVVH